MLQERLQPLIQLVEGKEWEEGLRLTKEWFKAHPENIVGNELELAYLCELPDEVRCLVTYPVIGNFVLSRLNGFQPDSEYQRSLLETTKQVIKETRFHNSHHTGNKKPLSLIKMKAELTAMMLERPDEAEKFYGFLFDGIKVPLTDIIYDKLQKVPNRTYTSDFGHGLCAPLDKFTQFVVSDFKWQMEYGATVPLDKAPMVVDDTDPEYWHGLLRLAGFQEREGQPGYFRDGESALPALERGDYDVILTDLELGEGKMNGIEFAQRARQVQLAKGRPAMIWLFSYNTEALEAAQIHGYRYPLEPKDLFFEQPGICSKDNFSPFHFKLRVIRSYETLGRI